MRGSLVEEIKTESQKIEKRFDAFLKIIGEVTDPQGKTFGVSQTIPNTDASVSDLRARMSVMAGLAKKFDPQKAALVPQSDCIGMLNNLRSIQQTFDQIEAQLNQATTSSGGIKSIDTEGFIATFANGQTTNLAPFFKQLFDSIEFYLGFFQNVLQSVGPNNAKFNFSSATDALAKVIRRTSNDREKNQKALQRAQSKLENLISNDEIITAILLESSLKQATISEQAAAADVAMKQISLKSDEAETLAEMAEELSDRVEQYDTEFHEFQTELDNRNKNIDNGNQKLEELIAKFDKQAETFNALIEKSNQMLSSATVSGLAGEFGSMKDKLTGQLTTAHKWFVGSILFLFISSIPLVLFIFAPLLALLMIDNADTVKAIAGMGSETNGWQYTGQIFARFVILLPAMWLLTFSNKRYDSIFKLREHYAYKYSMAFSVEGFKKQSPELEDMIAALVFEQLAFNPADKIGRQPKGSKKPPNQISNMLVNYLRGKLEADGAD